MVDSKHRYDHDGEHMWWLCDSPHATTPPAEGLVRDQEHFVINRFGEPEYPNDPTTPPAEGLTEVARAMWFAHTEDERFAGPVTEDPYGDFERALLAALAPEQPE